MVRNILHSFLLLSILLINFHKAFCQSKKDTSFLYRQISKNGYHAVFIDSKKSLLYNEIVCKITIDTSSYNPILQTLRDSAAIHSYKWHLPMEWYSLHQYKGKYYAYLPSEPYFNTYLKLSDSTLTLNYFNDGCVPALLQNVKWINKRTVQIQTKSLYTEDSVVILHFLNDSKTISVLEFPMREGKRRFQLMVAKKSLNSFPIIVNYCPDNRCPEWDFESPNFKSLLK